jgi:hypothetical protein
LVKVFGQAGLGKTCQIRLTFFDTSKFFDQTGWVFVKFFDPGWWENRIYWPGRALGDEIKA